MEMMFTKDELILLRVALIIFQTTEEDFLKVAENEKNIKATKLQLEKLKKLEEKVIDILEHIDI